LTNIIVQGVSNYTTNLAAGTLTFTLTDGQHATLIYQNQELPPEPATLTVIKTTCPTDNQTVFTYLITAPPGTFTLTDGQTWTSNNLPPGTYTITEHPQTGWNLINISVEGTTNYTTNLAAGTVSFTLEAGQNITLTYINLKHEPESGTITVDKRTVPSDSTVVFNFTTSTPAGTFSLTDRTSWSSGNLPPGTYIITELPTAGWNLTNIIVRGASNYTADVSTGTVTLHLASEENITITYQNAELPPQPNAFTVIKTTCPTGSTAIFNFVTSAPTGVFTLTDGQSWNSGNLPPGTYTITELTKAGWNLTNIIVEGTTNYTTNLTTGTITFTLEVGQHATILYQNTQLPPSTGTFTVIKSTCPMGSSAVFNFVTSAPTGTFTLTDGTSWNSGDLPPGAYTIAELAKAGWNLTNIIVDGATNYTINLAAGTVTFTLDAGHHVSIVYLNTELPPQPGTITVTKATCPTGASTPFSFVTSAPAGVFTLTDGQSWNSGNLPPGTYIITELAKAGWNLTNIIIDDPSGKSTIDLSTGTVTINLESGNHVTIIYQNTQLPPQPGTITVTKVTCPTGASTPFSFVTSAPAGTFTLIDGGVWNSGDLSSGKYIVTELNKAGWNLTNIIVVDPNDNSSVDLATGTVTINLEAGNHITIIYQNTEQTPEPDNCKKAPAVAVNAGDYPKPQ
ncbi:MAG: hypothetical protein LBI79_07300, partial [Nitrososphaerota archaeon]|nr:hypothetical protein [Nitrososphaerota archaeon]